MPNVRFAFFGGFEVRIGEGPAIFTTRKAQALLAYLAIAPGRPHSREKLTALLWGDRPEERARHNFRQALVALRKALGPGVVEAARDGVRLVGDAVEVDVVDFERLVADGSPETLERARGLYRGDLLDGFNVDEPAFEDWRTAQRERLHEVAVGAQARLLAHRLEAGPPEAAIEAAMQLLALDPWQEPVHRTLMRLLAAQGQRAAALKQYQVCVATLRRELGTEPEAETRRLYEEILVAQAASVSTLPPRDMAWPAPAPALMRTDSPFTGRDAELATLERALATAWLGRPLLAFTTGEAGIGKSRLTMELAAHAAARGGRILLGRFYESDQA